MLLLLRDLRTSQSPTCSERRRPENDRVSIGGFLRRSLRCLCDFWTGSMTERVPSWQRNAHLGHPTRKNREKKPKNLDLNPALCVRLVRGDFQNEPGLLSRVVGRLARKLGKRQGDLAQEGPPERALVPDLNVDDGALQQPRGDDEVKNRAPLGSGGLGHDVSFVTL